LQRLFALPMLEYSRANRFAASRCPKSNNVESPTAPWQPRMAHSTPCGYVSMGLQFFPRQARCAGESARPPLKPNGRAAIAVWTQINEIRYLPLPCNLVRERLKRRGLRTLMMAPFSWPGRRALREAAKRFPARSLCFDPTLPMVRKEASDQAISVVPRHKACLSPGVCCAFPRGLPGTPFPFVRVARDGPPWKAMPGYWRKMTQILS